MILPFAPVQGTLFVLSALAAVFRIGALLPLCEKRGDSDLACFTNNYRNTFPHQNTHFVVENALVLLGCPLLDISLEIMQLNVGQHIW